MQILGPCLHRVDSVGLKSKNLQVLTINPADSDAGGLWTTLSETHGYFVESVDLKNKSHVFLQGFQLFTIVY